jgi:hypothetical protein
MNYPPIHPLHSSDDDNVDSIEMGMLQEKPVAPIEDQYSPEDDSDNEAESTSPTGALLGHRTTPRKSLSLYDQIKNLVIEVVNLLLHPYLSLKL